MGVSVGLHPVVAAVLFTMFLWIPTAHSQGTSVCPQGCLCSGGTVNCDPVANNGRPWKFNRTLPQPLTSTLTSFVMTGNDLTVIRSQELVNATAITRLTLNNNRIKYLEVMTFQYQPSLQQLDLSGNHLRTLPLGVFANLSSLTTLNLANNWITTLPVSPTDPTINIFSGLTSLSAGSLSLHGNSFYCDCTLSWLPNFIVNNQTQIAQVRSITCQEPAAARGVLLLETERANPLLTYQCSAPNIMTSPLASVVNTTATIQLACIAAGLPNPDVTWYLDDAPVSIDYYRLNLARDGALVISNARHEDEGLYTCNASNTEGFAVSQSAQLKVDEITCYNVALNTNETDIDCGGPLCNPCDNTQKCLIDRDCVAGSVCLGSHRIASELLYISDQSNRYLTCAPEAEPGSTLVARLRDSIRGRASPLSTINGTEDKARLTQELHGELIAQLQIPQTHISNVRIESEARHRRPLYKVRFAMATGAATNIRTALNQQLHRGDLHGTLAYLDGNVVQLVL